MKYSVHIMYHKHPYSFPTPFSCVFLPVTISVLTSVLFNKALIKKWFLLLRTTIGALVDPEIVDFQNLDPKSRTSVSSSSWYVSTFYLDILEERTRQPNLRFLEGPVIIVASGPPSPPLSQASTRITSRTHESLKMGSLMSSTESDIESIESDFEEQQRSRIALNFN